MFNSFANIDKIKKKKLHCTNVLFFANKVDNSAKSGFVSTGYLLRKIHYGRNQPFVLALICDI